MEKIANRQLFIILFFARSTVKLAFLPALTSADALQDAWISAALSFFGAALLVFMIGGLAVRFPQETIVEYSQKLLGKWPGKLISLIPIGTFLFIAATDVRIYAEALTAFFITDTPLLFIIGTMVFAAALGAYAGIEPLGRVADLFLPLYLLFLLLCLGLAIPQSVLLLRNIEPVLARGMGPVLRGALTPIAMISQYTVLTILTPSLTEPKRVMRTAFGASLFASSLLVVVTMASIAVLGPHKAARCAYPFVTLVRSLRASEFLERVEVLAMFAWGFIHFVGLVVYLYCGVKGASQVLGLKNYRVLVGPMAVIWITLGVHGYRDFFQLRTLFLPALMFPLSALGFVVIPFGILWLAYGIRILQRRI